MSTPVLLKELFRHNFKTPDGWKSTVSPGHHCLWLVTLVIKPHAIFPCLLDNGMDILYQAICGKPDSRACTFQKNECCFIYENL